MNQVAIHTDKGEYLPGDYVCGAVYLNIQAPTEAHGVELSFKGKESVCCETEIDGTKTNLQESQEYVDFHHTVLFSQREPFALGSYCFPFKLQLPHQIPGTFKAVSRDHQRAWSASVDYVVRTNILGTQSLVAEQDVVVKAMTPEAVRCNNITKAVELKFPSGRLLFSRHWHLTVKFLENYVKTGDCARLRMVFSNAPSASISSFTLKLIRNLVLTFPVKHKTLDKESGDPKIKMERQEQQISVEGGPFTIREVTGAWPTHNPISSELSGLDRIMIPLKDMNGRNLIPSVQGKHVKCDYSLEVILRYGEDRVQIINCPIAGILPEDNNQWLSWTPSQWMQNAKVLLGSGPISPALQVLGSESFAFLPGF